MYHVTQSTFAAAVGVLTAAMAGAAGAAVVTDNLVYNWASGGRTANSWQSTAPASGKSDSANRLWTWSDTVTDVSSGSAATNITDAYDFAGGYGASNSSFYATPASLAPDHSVEMWIKPDSLTGGKQVLMESGGNVTGWCITLQNDTIYLAVLPSGGSRSVLSAPALTSTDLADYIQIVTTVSDTGLALYVNPVTTAHPQTAAATGAGTTWAGGDHAGLGGINPAMGAGGGSGSGQWDSDTFISFDGKIGLVRIYDDVLGDTEVADNFHATVIPEPATLSLLIAGGMLMLRSRKRRA